MGKIGGALFEGNSKLWSGPLGVVKVGFEGYDLGLTTADATLTPDQDVKDIIYQQEGTKPADHVRTGIEYILAAVFGEIKTGLLVQLMAGVSTANTSALDDDGTIDRNIYQSMLATEAGGLRVIAVDENGVASELDVDILQFYDVIPVIDGELVQWGADTQRNLPVNFRIKWHRFGSGESVGKSGAFGYWGDPVAEDVPAITWPDVEAPGLVTATALTATTLALVFDENIAFQTAFVIGHYITKINGVYTDALSGIIATTTLTITYGASTFSSGDVIEISVSELSLEDTVATPNTYEGVDAQAVTNSVP